MSLYDPRSLSVPESFARAIVRARDKSFSIVMNKIEENMRGRMMNVRSGASLANVKSESQSRASATGFELSFRTSKPSLIAWMEGSTRKAYFVRPVTANALAFTVNGKLVFSKGHQIPAWTFSPKRPVIRDGVERSLDEVGKVSAKEIIGALQGAFPDVKIQMRVI